MESEKLVLEAKAKQLMYISSTITLLGLIAGYVYANRTGGGLLRYLGYGFVGSMVGGLIGHVSTMSASNKLLEQAKNLEKNKPV